MQYGRNPQRRCDRVGIVRHYVNVPPVHYQYRSLRIWLVRRITHCPWAGRVMCVQNDLQNYWYEFTYDPSRRSLVESVVHGYITANAEVLQRERTLSNTHTGPGYGGAGVTDSCCGSHSVTPWSYLIAALPQPSETHSRESQKSKRTGRRRGINHSVNKLRESTESAKYDRWLFRSFRASWSFTL